jgi:hypothetical protein
MKTRILIAVVAVLAGVCFVVPSSAAQDNPDDVYWDNTIALAGGGLNGPVTAMTVYDDKLIVAGEFTTAGGLPANHIAAWDGTAWSPLGSGINGSVGALTVYNGNLIVGGGFTTAGGTSASNIASWDGTAWSPLGSGINGGVGALTVYNGTLIAGGGFTTAGGTSASNIASWDGTAWSPLGSGINGGVNALTLYNGNLVAGGRMADPAPVGSWHVSSWDGTTWSKIWSVIECDSRCGYWLEDLAVYDNKLIVAWDFYSFRDGYFGHVEYLYGDGWGYLLFVRGIINALVVRDNELIAGGSFGEGNVEEFFANNIASFDGRAWSPLGSGLNGTVTVLTAFDNKLIVGGNFTVAGNKVSPYLATWTKHARRYVWHVAVNGDDLTGDGSEQYPFATIQHGVVSALTGDTVLVHPGTYTGPGNRDIDFHGKDIVLMSEAGPEVTIIDCQGTELEPHRGFWYHSGETNAARVEGFTITNGYAPEDDTVITDLGTLVYAHGGGIFCDSASSPTIKECRIINNHALWKGYGSGGDGGGGIYCYKSSPVLEDNVISGNSSDNGGGVALSQSSAHLIRNLIVDNHSSHEAGGVALLGSTDVLESNTISGNTAVVGGGVWLNSSSPTMARCVISFNSGGSFVCSGSSNVPVLTFCDIYESGIYSWPACISGQLGQNGNFSADPMFCDAANGDYHLSGYSPCAPANNYWDGTLIGALEPACNNLLCGDANMDGQLTSADVELLQAYYFFQTPPDTYVPVGAADMDCNDRISLNDLVMLAGYVYGHGPTPCCAPPPPPPKRPELPTPDFDAGGPIQ